MTTVGDFEAGEPDALGEGLNEGSAEFAKDVKGLDLGVPEAPDGAGEDEGAALAQPATRTTMLSNMVTGRWFVPLIVCLPRLLGGLAQTARQAPPRSATNPGWRVRGSRT